jgi:hypothetical protein
MPQLGGGSGLFNWATQGQVNLGGSFGSGTVGLIGGAVSDMFSADALRFKQKGDILEAQQYRLASQLAELNKTYTKESTDIKEFQLQRKDFQTEGDLAADIAANNFEQSGSAIDVMRDSATQAAIERGVASQQGLIEEAGYEEQAQSYQLMAQAKDEAAQADAKAAQGATWSAIFKGVGAIASIL